MTPIEKKLAVLATVGIFVMAPLPALAGVTIDVVPSSAPNAFGSPSWAGYAANALNALENGLSNIGSRATDPTAYERLNGTAQPSDMMVTSFHSWRGIAGPAAPFDLEYGNRLHFGVDIRGDGTTQFKLNDLSFEIDSSDTANTANPNIYGGQGSLGFAGNFIGYSYGPTRIGIDYGPDHLRGTFDDIEYASGNGTTLVDEIVYVGVGNALWPMVPDDGATGQEALDSVGRFISDNIDWVKGTYWILGSDQQTYVGSALVDVPEPATLAVFGLGLAGLGFMRRRRAA